MGSSSTQAVALIFWLAGFVVLAGAFAGGGILLGVGALILLGVSAFIFMKCKSLEQQKD